MVAPAKTSHAEFTRNRSRAINEARAKTTVRVSTKDARASSQVTAAINASDATFTPSRKAPAGLDFRIRGTSGPLTATSRNADARRTDTRVKSQPAYVPFSPEYFSPPLRSRRLMINEIWHGETMDAQRHWENNYGKKAADAVSWYRPHLKHPLNS